MSSDDAILSDYRLSRSNLYDLLAGVVGKLNDMEARQSELMRYNGELTNEVNALKSEVSAHKHTIASLSAQSMILEEKVSNISFSIQGYTADGVDPGVEAVSDDVKLPAKRSSIKTLHGEGSYDSIQPEANIASPSSSSAMDGGVGPPIKANGKVLMSKWRHAARRAVLLTKLGKLFKNKSGGVENTRLPKQMNIQERLKTFDNHIFEITTHLINHSKVLEKHFADIKLRTEIVDHEKLASVVEKHGGRLTEQGKALSSLRGDLSMEANERGKGDKTLKDYISNVVEKKLDAVEAKTWENVDSITNVEAHIVKCENKVNDNTENIAAIQEELAKPPVVVENKNIDNTDWSILLEYSKQFHYFITKVDNDSGAELRTAMEKIFKLITTCIELARNLKDIDDGKIPESRKLTKTLELLAWALHSAQKQDEERLKNPDVEKEKGAKSAQSTWIPMDSIFSSDNSSTLKLCVYNISMFVHDAVRPRVDTVDLQIQIKEHDQALGRINDINVKQQAAVKKINESLKERPKQSVLQEFIDKAEGIFDELRGNVKAVKENSEKGLQAETESLSSLKEEVTRSNNTVTFNIKALKDELKGKASAADIASLKNEVHDSTGKIEKEIPKLNKAVLTKVDSSDLESLKAEIMKSLSEVNVNSDKNSTAMLGGRAYCLSCQQPVKGPSGPESDNIHSYYDGGGSRPETLGPRPSSVGRSSSSLPSAKGAFPPALNTTWNPNVSPRHSGAPSGSSSVVIAATPTPILSNDVKVQLPGMAKSKSTSAIAGDDASRVVISPHSRMIPIVTYTDKSGKVTTKSLGGPGLVQSGPVKDQKKQ